MQYRTGSESIFKPIQRIDSRYFKFAGLGRKASEVSLYETENV